METERELTGLLAKLPGGDLVRIEKVYLDGFAAVRRTQGPHAGLIALCVASKLEEIKTNADDDCTVE
jgi:hypothetical protein